MALYKPVASYAGEFTVIQSGDFLDPASGGTGLGSFTAGSFLYASSTSVLGLRTPAQVKADLAITPADIGAQPSNAALSSIGGLTTVADRSIYATGSNTYAVYTLTAGGRALASVAGTADTAPYFSASNTVTLAPVSAAGRAYWNATGTADTLPYFSATNTLSYQSVTAGGRALLGVTGTANTLPYFSATNVVSSAPISANGRSLVGATDYAAMRIALGVAATPLVGQKWGFVGDSITQLSTHPALVGDLTGLNDANYGLFGMRWAEESPRWTYDDLTMCSIATAISTGTFTAQIAAANALFTNAGIDVRSVIAAMDAEDWTTVPYMSIMFGVNDFGSNRPIGLPDSTTVSTFKGAINFVISTIQAALPNIQITLVTPTYTNNSETPNTVGARLSDYADAIIERGAAHKLPVLDMLRSGGINSYNYVTFLPDGVHPNTAGHQRLAEKFAGFILTRGTNAGGPQPRFEFARTSIWSM